jgi:hypothetical protein
MSDYQKHSAERAAREAAARKDAAHVPVAKTAVPVATRKFAHNEDAKEQLYHDYPAPVALAASPPADSTVVVQTGTAPAAASVTTHANFPATVAASAEPPCETTFDVKPLSHGAAVPTRAGYVAPTADVTTAHSHLARDPHHVPAHVPGVRPADAYVPGIPGPDLKAAHPSATHPTAAAAAAAAPLASTGAAPAAVLTRGTGGVVPGPIAPADARVPVAPSAVPLAAVAAPGAAVPVYRAAKKDDIYKDKDL